MPINGARRASKPKARTGCRTCKIRHVKCDEKKPECIRCLKAGFDCDGYPDLTPAEFAKRVILPKNQQALFIEIPCTPAFKDESEFRYFNLFQSQTAGLLSGYFDFDVWSRLILQVCHHEEFARYGVVALAALTRTNETLSLVSRFPLDKEHDYQTAMNHREVALKYYDKSLKIMRQRTEDVDDPYHLRNILISCLLTICFENFQGNQGAALAQAASGIILLSQFQEQMSSNSISMQATTNHGLSTIDPELINAFARIEIVVMMFMETKPEQSHLLLQIQQASDALDNMPMVFYNLKEAKTYWDIIVRRAIHFYYDDSNNLSEPRCHSATEEELLGVSILVNREERKRSTMVTHLETSTRWLQAFQPLLRRLHSSSEGHIINDFQGASVLMIHFLVARLSHPFSSDVEIVEDSTEIVRLASEVLELDSRKSSHMSDKGHLVFFFDSNLISPLFSVATRCRKHSVRREAISLMKIYSRREGFWDSAMAARVAEWFVDVEEEGIYEEEVSPDSRLRLVSNKIELSKRRAVVRCAKHVKGELTEALQPVTLMW